MHFFDTYAIIEFLKGNRRYLKYFETGGILTKLNLMEVYFYVLKTFGKKEAERIYASFSTYVADYDEDLMKEAMIFKLEMKRKKRDISYTDAIGYILAKRKGIKFLTGDKEFQGLKNVEFIK